MFSYRVQYNKWLRRFNSPTRYNSVQRDDSSQFNATRVNSIHERGESEPLKGSAIPSPNWIEASNWVESSKRHHGVHLHAMLPPHGMVKKQPLGKTTRATLLYILCILIDFNLLWTFLFLQVLVNIQGGPPRSVNGAELWRALSHFLCAGAASERL